MSHPCQKPKLYEITLLDSTFSDNIIYFTQIFHSDLSGLSTNQVEHSVF